MTDLEPFRMPECKCLGCGRALDCASNMLSADSPGPGDITICLTCGKLMAFKDDLSFRELTGTEMIEVLKDPRVALLERARQEVMPPSKSRVAKP